MISESRFEEELILLGLLPDRDGSSSLLQLEIRDPGGNMTEGFRPAVRRAELPMTKMAERSIDGKASLDVEGYSDYRGVQVVGAWSWLPEYRFGIATEADVAEAYRPLTILKIAFWSLMLLLGICSIGLLMFAVVASRLQREAREAAIEAKQLGQYELKDKIGELCQMQISETPQEPTAIVKEIPQDLEGVIMSCLEKDRSRRPQSARELARLLNSCAAADNWDTDRAQHWWNRHLRKTADAAETTNERFAATMDSSVGK
jgi:hypothetical protein